MTTKLAVGLAILLAALILVPVAAVVALGAYGSSLEGHDVTAGSGDAELVIFPFHGLPGSPLKVTGKRWPPRSGVEIWLRRPGAGPNSKSSTLRLAEIVTSRRGTFEFDTTIPVSIVPIGTATVRIQATGRKADTDNGEVLAAPFRIEPFPNELTISVVDASSGLASAGAIVRIEDSYGQEVALEKTSSRGEVSLAGIRPDIMRVTVRQVDYAISAVAVEVPESGQAGLRVALKKSPGKRLLFFLNRSGDDGETFLVGLDRTSGLPIRERIAVPPGKLAPVSVGRWNLSQGFFLPVDEGAQSIGAGIGDGDVLWAMGAAGRQLRSMSQGFWTALWHSYVGRSLIGDVIHSRESTQIPDPGSYLYIVDPESGRIVFRQRMAHYILRPVLSSDGTRIYLINWDARSVDVLDLPTGKQTTIVERLPVQVVEAIADPSDESRLILSATDGAVYSFHMVTGEITEIYRGGRIQSVVRVGDEGRLITSAFGSRELVVSSLETGQIQAVIPLQSQVTWLWADPTGPFIFAATVSWPNVISVQVIDSNTLRVLDAIEIPRVELVTE